MSDLKTSTEYELCHIVESEDLEKFRTILSNGNYGDINKAAKRVGLTPLHIATRNGYLEMVKELVAKGANVNVKGGIDGRIPLHSAVLSGELELIKFLIESGSDINVRDFYDWTPLHVAAHSQSSIIQMLLSIPGININARNNDGWTPLYYIVFFSRNKEDCELLFQHGANPDITHWKGDTILHRIVRHVADGGSDRGFLELFLRYGANPFLKNNDGETPIDIARRNKLDKEMIEILQNYFPSFQILTKRCIRDNGVDVSKLPKIMFV